VSARKVTPEGWWKIIIELSSIISLAGFVLAAVIQHIIYNAYGIKILKIANITDIARSGIEMLVTMIEVFILFGLILIPFAVMGFMRNGKKFAFLAISTSITSAILYVLTLIGLISPITQFDFTLVPAGTLLLFVIGVAGLVRPKFFENNPIEWVANRFSPIVIASFVILVNLLFSGSLTIAVTVHQLDVGIGNWAPGKGEEVSENCGSGVVVWIGSEHVIVRCARGYVVVREADGSVTSLGRNGGDVQTTNRTAVRTNVAGSSRVKDKGAAAPSTFLNSSTSASPASRN